MRCNYHKLGQFELTGSDMRISYPCYEKSTWCSGMISDCLPGRWDAAVSYLDEGKFGTRVALLTAKHSETVRSFALCNQFRADDEYIYYQPGWKICNLSVGVDSGQAGIFDDAHYRDDHVFDGLPEAEHDFQTVWYSHCCDLTLGKQQAGVIPYGVVSSSGYGDGCYTALRHLNAAGKVDCIAVLFLSDQAQMPG